MKAVGKKGLPVPAPVEWNLLQGEAWVAELESLNTFKCCNKLIINIKINL